MSKRTAVLLALAVVVAAFTPASASQRSSTAVWSVVRNESVTMRLEGFPANDTIYVRMNYRDTLGVNGVLVSKLTTNTGGTFLAKFPIPDKFKDEDVIAIRFESQTTSIPAWYNYFFNQTATTTPSSGDTDDGVTYNNLVPGFPTFTLTEMKRGAYISILTKYFPAGDRFAILLEDGAKEIYNNWIEVAGVESAEGGSFPVTFDIPSSLQYKEKLAVMFYRIKDGFRTYDLYLNQDYP